MTKVLSFRRRAADKAAPSSWALRASPFAWNVLMMVVPPNRGNPSTTTSSLRASVVTLPPASRQIRTVTVSNACPLLPNTPTLAHAEHWWPRESSGRPLLQKRAVKGSGRWRRRTKTTRNSCGGILVTRHVGHVDRARPAPRPPWERKSAWPESVNLPNKSSSRKRWSIREAASCCQPRLLPGSNSSGWWRSGLAPFRMAIHDGGLHPRTPSGNHAATWAAREWSTSSRTCDSPTAK